MSIPVTHMQQQQRPAAPCQRVRSLLPATLAHPCLCMCPGHDMVRQGETGTASRPCTEHGRVNLTKIGKASRPVVCLQQLRVPTPATHTRPSLTSRQPLHCTKHSPGSRPLSLYDSCR